jgi:stearoyl-CoA desaturase (delta-9 desaturase)
VKESVVKETNIEVRQATQPQKRQLDYIKAIPLFSIIGFTTLVVVPWYGVTYGYSWLDWTLFGILYLITGLGITVGYHRLISHRSFECHPAVRVAFLIAGGWALENSAIKWGADHVRHHAFTDTDDDPYNAKRGFWYSHCGWIFYKTQPIYEKFRAPFLRDKWLVWQERYYIPIVISGLLLPALVSGLFYGWQGAIGAFLLAGVARVFLVLNSTFCINSICHLWGTQPYDAKNTSRDSWWISLITLGEGYHNYHHAFQRDYRNGPKLGNFDPSKWLIFMLYKIGLADNLVRGTKGGISS